MKSFLPDYDLVAPPSLAEALDMIAREPGKWRPIAGGTDLMVLFEAGKLPYTNLLSLWHLNELRGAEETESHLILGALTTYTELRNNPVIARQFPLLVTAASWTGGVATQNRGTIGGNIANASPAADTPPALLVYGAELELRSATSSRWVPYSQIHTAYKQTVLRQDELITRIRLPFLSSDWFHFSRKVGARKAQAISKVCLAATALMNGFTVTEVRVALGSVAPIPMRCLQTEATLKHRKLDEAAVQAAKDAISAEIGPIDDIRSTASYRSRVTVNVLEQFLRTMQFRACCGSHLWAQAMAERHPFSTRHTMLTTAEEIWWSLGESAWKEAFASHPKIGDAAHNNSTAAKEQQGVAGASAGTLAALASSNQKYLDRFGHIYIVCASGKTSSEMLGILQSRLSNSPADEIRIAAAEQAKITALRLQEFLL